MENQPERIEHERTPEFLEAEGRRLSHRNTKCKANQRNRTMAIVDRGEGPYRVGKHRFVARPAPYDENHPDFEPHHKVVEIVEPHPAAAKKIAKRKRKSVNADKTRHEESVKRKDEKRRKHQEKFERKLIKEGKMKPPSPLARFLKKPTK